MDIFKFVGRHYLVHLLPVWAVAVPLAYVRQDISILAVASLFAVGIDADHLVDYLLSPHRRGFDLREALLCRYFSKAPRVYLPLHAYDLHLAATALLLWQDHVDLALAWAAGFIIHIVTDEVLGHSKGNDPLRNVLMYRLVNRFDRRLYEESA